MSRRSFLLLTLAALSGTLVWVWLTERQTARPAPSGTSRDDGPSLAAEWRELPDDLKPAMAESLRRQTGIVIRLAVGPFTAPGGHITGLPPSRDDAKAAALIVANELQRYPDSYLRAAEVDTIVLVGDIRAGGRGFGGLASPPNRALLMTTESSSEFWRHTLHHEIFHLFDRGRFDDIAWEALNPSGFRYDPGQAFIKDPGVAFGINPTLYGFISRYSMFNAREDRAELFAWLLMDHASVIRVAAHDSHLAAKVRRLKDDIIGRVPEIDDRFWGTQ